MAPKKNQSALPQEIIDQYDTLLNDIPDVERKGAKNPYTSYNGNMFTFLDNKTGKLSIRLPKDEREAFIEKHKTSLSFQYGTVMKEYVVVPDDLFNDKTAMKLYMNKSFHYVQSLKAKPGKKKL